MNNTVQIALQVTGGPAARAELVQTSAAERSMVSASATATAQAAAQAGSSLAAMRAGLGRSVTDQFQWQQGGVRTALEASIQKRFQAQQSPAGRLQRPAPRPC